MSILTTIGNFLFGKPPTGGAPSSLRNKRGGLAFISGGRERALLGRVVTTVRVESDGKWLIEPKQRFVSTICATSIEGRPIRPGDDVTCTAVVDDCLTPISAEGVTDSEVHSLYEPSPTKETV